MKTNRTELSQSSNHHLTNSMTPYVQPLTVVGTKTTGDTSMNVLKKSKPNAKDYENKYGMEFIESIPNMDIEKIKFNETYQRSQENSKITKIANSMKKYGYWPFQIIILNDKNEVVDGQHRIWAAKIVGIQHVPVCVFKFKDIQSEAEFFADLSNYNTNLKPLDYWHARYISGDNVAEIIYKLESDPTANLCGNISIKHRQHKTKISIGSVLSILLPIVGINKTAWEKSMDWRLTKLIESHNYVYIKSELNNFMLWIDMCFGDKKHNPTVYVAEHFRAIVRFYRVLLENGVKPVTTVRKMKSYIFTSDFKKITHAGRVFSLISHYNSGKKPEDKIKFSDMSE